MKKSFEYDLTKYDPSAPKKTEEFLTADGVKTLTTDANDGAVLIQDEVDEDSLNPVTGAAVAAAIEAGGGGGGGTEYSAGDGIDISEDTISVKVDGDTIVLNGSGELVANGGGGGTSYSAGNGLSINGNTIAVEADLSTGLAFKPGYLESTTISGETSYRSFAFDREPLGHNISISFNNTGSNTTISSSASQNGATLRFALCDSDQGFGYHVMLLGTKDIVDADSGNAVICAGTTQSVGRLVSDLNEDVFENEYVPYGDYSYGDWAFVESICLVAYDSSEDVIVGDPIVLLGSDAQFKAEGDFIVRPLTNLKPLPYWDKSDPSEDAGKSLQVQSNGTIAWATAAGGTTVLGNDVSMNWNSNGYYCYYDFSSDVASKITTGIYLVRFRTTYSTVPDELSDLGAPAMITAGIWSRTGGQWGFESQFVLLPSTNGAGTTRTFEGTGVFTIDDSSFVPEYFRLKIHDQGGANISTAPGSKKITVVKIG